jgi:uncharacterized membrane protein
MSDVILKYDNLIYFELVNLTRDETHSFAFEIVFLHTVDFVSSMIVSTSLDMNYDMVVAITHQEFNSVTSNSCCV